MLAFAAIAGAQTGPAACAITADPPLVRLEGVSERLGDILLDCVGGRPGAVTEGNITIFLPVNVTNRLSATGAPDVSLSVDAGSGFQPSVSAVLQGTQGVAFNGVQFTIPASGKVTLRIANLRANVSQFGMAQRPIQAQIALNGLRELALQGNLPTIAFAERGLLASFGTRSIRCVGSPLPETIDIPSLVAKGTFFSPARVTEAFPSAFQPREATDTNATRIISRYSGFPASARLFVPDVIAGSSSELLALRVLQTDANGAGGMTVTPGTMGVNADSVTEIPLTNGAGIAVYEIVSANSNVRESFTFPTFVGLAPVSEPAVASQELFFAPLSATPVASASAPAPRFAAVAPASDCDRPECAPQMVISGQPLQFAGFAGGAGWNPRYIGIRNENAAVVDMPWTVSVAYKNGADWLMFDPQSGVNNATVRFDALMQKLTPGKYEATVTIDAGPLGGTRTLPVVVMAAGLPDLPPARAITVTSYGNAASPWPGALTPGSLGTIKGENLGGDTVAVAFNNRPAKLFYTSPSQINLLVPAELGAATSASMVITVDGAASAPQTVNLAPVAPAIFPNGILNQNGTPNGLNSAAPVGSVIAMWVTGLTPAVGQTSVTVKIHDREGLLPLYAGAAPSLQGVQQVNVAIPKDLPAMTTEVLVCATDAAGRPVCSLPLKLTLSQ